MLLRNIPPYQGRLSNGHSMELSQRFIKTYFDLLERACAAMARVGHEVVDDGGIVMPMQAVSMIYQNVEQDSGVKEDLRVSVHLNA